MIRLGNMIRTIRRALRRFLADHIFPWMYPGTQWEMDVRGHGRCLNCNKGYNSHGSVEMWSRLKMPKGTAHLVCQPRKWSRASMSRFA